ncbi:MAG: Fmu (Sun) protein [Ferruginibacter sp.]|nr:Fmu (Sun) protein [Ferruginibacter sp.]
MSEQAPARVKAEQAETFVSIMPVTPAFFIMSRYHSYLAAATRIIETYQPPQPFALHLKKFFAADKKYGSTDRKKIGTLCYHYFRVGRAFPSLAITDKILNGAFLCENTSSPLLELLKPELNEHIEWALPEKLELLGIVWEDIFPFAGEIGEAVDANKFSLSLLQQPDLFLRIRPGKKEQALHKLTAAAIGFEEMGEDALRLRNASALQNVLTLNEEVLVQDLSSQQVFDEPGIFDRFSKDPKIAAWDCCAASGGKSILLYDRLDKKPDLTVTDIRENILQNLKLRLKEARVAIRSSGVADLTRLLPFDWPNFPLIICDAPCTGSGTWSRTPEQLYYFKEKQLAEYSALQKKIASRAAAHLDSGGLFFYITCSVFAAENEQNVQYLAEGTNLKFISSHYINGYENRADTMFVAVFTTKD